VVIKGKRKGLDKEAQAASMAAAGPGLAPGPKRQKGVKWQEGGKWHSAVISKGAILNKTSASEPSGLVQIRDKASAPKAFKSLFGLNVVVNKPEVVDTAKGNASSAPLEPKVEPEITPHVRESATRAPVSQGARLDSTPKAFPLK